MIVDILQSVGIILVAISMIVHTLSHVRRGS